jgi:hypothetical protein
MVIEGPFGAVVAALSRRAGMARADPEGAATERRGYSASRRKEAFDHGLRFHDSIVFNKAS